MKGTKIFILISLTRPVFKLKCGQVTLRERILRNFPGVDVSYLLRDYLAPVFSQDKKGVSVNKMEALRNDDILLINGRWLLSRGELNLTGEEEVGIYGEETLYLRVKTKTMKTYFSSNFTELINFLKQRLKKKEVKARLVIYPWDLINNNCWALEEDFQFRVKKGIQGELPSSATIYGEKDRVFIARSATIQPLVLLDCTEGSIYINEGTIVFAHSHIKGPSYIGKKSQILGANIGEGTSIGPVCRNRRKN